MNRFLLVLALVAALLLVLIIRPANAALSQADFFVYLPLVARAPNPTPSPSPSPSPNPSPGPAANNLAVSAATYLGGSGSDNGTAVDVAPDGTLVMGGTFSGYTPPGITPVTLLNGTNGAIVRLSSNGRSILSMTRIGTRVTDLEVTGSGQIVVCGDFGVAVLNATATSTVWSAAPGTGNRCAVGSDGTVAVLVGGSVYVYDNAGNAVANWGVSGSAKNDLAVDGGNQQIIVTGFVQDNGYKCSQLQNAFVRSFSYSGQAKWKSYDWNKVQAGDLSLCADTRGYRVAIGRDGKLYFAGESAGGNTIYSRDPKNISTALGQDRLPKTDMYNNPYNTSSNHITFYARLNPVDGSLEKGQFLLSRLSSGKGNTILPRSIMADTNGRLYVAGISACCSENRKDQQLAGIPIKPYEGDAFLLIVRPDFGARVHWTPFPGGGEPAVSVRNGTAAFVTSSTSGNLNTYNAIQAAISTGPDAYIAAWQQSAE